MLNNILPALEAAMKRNAIARLSLSRPGLRLSLRLAENAAVAETPTSPGQTRPVLALQAGFWQPLAASGSVCAGQILGAICCGDLRLPVCAPQNGDWQPAALPAGARVDWGTALGALS